MRALAFVGRHATKFMAGGVLIGFVVPPLAALAKPLLVPALVIPLALALIRLDWSAIAASRRRPGLDRGAAWSGSSACRRSLVWAVTTPAHGAGPARRPARGPDPDVGFVADRVERRDRALRRARRDARTWWPWSSRRRSCRSRCRRWRSPCSTSSSAQPARLHGAARGDGRRRLRRRLGDAAHRAPVRARGKARPHRRARRGEPRRLRDRHHGRRHRVCAGTARVRRARDRAGVRLQHRAAGRRLDRVPPIAAPPRRSPRAWSPATATWASCWSRCPGTPASR